MDPAINLLQEMSELNQSIKDNQLATPQQDPSSPFLSPPSASDSLCIVNSNQQPMSTDDRLRKLALKSQDADHRRRFERYLNDCGVKRQSLSLAQTTDELNSIVHNLLDNQNLTDDEKDSLLNEEHEDFDLFYRDHGDHFMREISFEADGIDVVENDDSEFTYIKSDYVPTNAPLIATTLPPALPLNLQDSYLYWESKSKEEFQKLDSPIEYSDEPQWAVRKQPASKFSDSLDLKFGGIARLNYEYGKKYKNNLSCFSNEFQTLFTASNSEVFVYKIELNDQPCKTPILRFETKPNFVTERDRNSSTWPYFPFTINFMKIDTFLNKEILAVTCDNGKVLIWFVDLLLRQIPSYELVTQQRAFNNGIYGIRIHPDFQLRVECSAWSVDFYNKFNMIAVSDNSQSISIFYLEDTEARFYTVSTHQVLHNIPDVSFVKDEENDAWRDNRLKVRVACASIRCELIEFEFVMFKVYGPYANLTQASGVIMIDTDEDMMTDNVESFERVIFDSPRVVSRTLLSEDVWTVNCIDGKFFKKVNSLKSMTGDQYIDESELVNRSIRQNRMLDTESDPCVTSDLGLVAKFQFFEIPTEMLHGGNNSSLMMKNFNTVSDRFRRIRKMYDSYYLSKQRSKQKVHKSINGKLYWEPVIKTSKNNRFLCVTSSSKLGLFNTERLLCVSSTTTSVFDFNLSFGEEASYSNRLSLSCVVPELSCIVIGSQIGLVSIFRLCSYRGCFGMRQEYLFPNASRLALGDRGYRTITGLCVRKVSKSREKLSSRYVLYITYIDGLVLCYDLSERNNGLDLVDL